MVPITYFIPITFVDMNHRHHMAQLAARTSVEFFTHLYFRDSDKKKNGGVREEEAYIIKMVKNGFAALIPKYGVEGLVFLSSSSSSSSSSNAAASDAIPAEWGLEYDPEGNCIVSSHNSNYKLEIFQKIRVLLQPIDEKDARASLSRRQLKFCLTWPSPLNHQ